MNRSFAKMTARSLPLAITLALPLAATLASGCGGSSDTDPSVDPGQSACHGTITGSITAMITDCSFTWSRRSTVSTVANNGHIDTTADGTEQYSGIGFTFLFPGAAATPRTLDPSSVEEVGGGITLANGGLYGVAKPGYGHTGPTFGSATMTITSTELGDLPDTWKLHGKLTAALKTPPGVTTYSGSADVEITF